ncbi:MAG TPA: methionine--tRNA ligase [Candidatus Syntrophoarchaeum butanivorans]|uniref:Methionine--tRNA ligase n=1 Tax=Candidatus Syntropharchaeum butanivorans TaxID=1839936 RepID=A0A7C1B2U6_9EURY|nr:methionine--tRNA ligase [Candidatus Syntrophoarchaeum butanivorans]
MEDQRPHVVTCGLPYANGPAHIGHLRTYIPADIYVRTLRKLGENPVFICGSDTHGTPIVVNAEQLGITPKELVTRYHRYFDETFRKLGVIFDNYGSTDSEFNHRRTQQIVKELIDRGYVYPKSIELAYCPVCEMFLPDRYVDGKCPYCGSPARGDECDQGCGRHLEPGEILDPVCRVCGTRAESRIQEHYFFRLSAFKDFLLEYLARLEGTSNARNYALGWVKGELKDWCITRNLDWGVKFPGRDDLVVYVWVDAPIGYISSTEQWAEKTGESWERYWKGDARITHFIGSDIIYHHCIFWPAMLKGAGYTLPTAVVASGMVKIDDKTFSKSRGYVVWVDEYLENGFHPDLLRYYLASYTSHTKELNFSWKIFQEKCNNELVAILGNLAYRTLLFAFRNFGEVPEGEIDEGVIEKIRETIGLLDRSIREYEPKRMVDSVMALANFGNGYFQSHKPWELIKEDKGACGVVIRNALQIVKALAVLLEPVMPSKMEELWHYLGMETDIHSVGVKEALVPIEAGVKLKKPRILFEKIEDDAIEKMENLLRGRIEGGEEDIEKEDIEKMPELVSFDEFMQLDIRIGRVVEAEAIKGSRKLLRLLVDIGEEEPRQIVAGIAGIYKPEELLNREIVVLANLKPAKIFGYDSMGMLLAAGEGVLLVPDREVNPGERVR